MFEFILFSSFSIKSNVNISFDDFFSEPIEYFYE